MAVAEAIDLYTGRFEQFLQRRGQGDPVWLTTIRRNAYARFAALGFPTTRDEDWRFLPIGPVAETAFGEPAARTPVPKATMAPFTVRQMRCTQIVFVNGRFDPALSTVGVLGRNVLATNLSAALVSDPGLVDPYFTRCAPCDRQAFVALNTAFAEDGAFLHIPANVTVPEPIHVIYYSTSATPMVTHPRTIVVAGDNSQAKVIESYGGPDGQRYLTNAVTEIVVGENARLEHYRVQREGHHAYHLASTSVHLERSATFQQQSVSFGGAIARHEVNAVLAAEGIHCTLDGLYLGTGTRLVGNLTSIDHAKPYCESHEVYKGMLDGQARGVFNGKIFVRPQAQKTDAKQTNKVLLLSDDATINTKPQLEIFADDVKCTHGATVGQLDDTALFYLRARGIGYQQARAMLVHAFASDIIDRITIEPLRVALEEALLTELPKAALAI
jgi:Fe-S cluster assembly protein SufD